MNIKELEQTVMANPMVALTAMRLKKQHFDEQLTPEERQANKDRYLAYRNERIRKAQIIQNICPSCEGKLIRGKKNKKNEYKRDWNCVDCGELHSI